MPANERPHVQIAAALSARVLVCSVELLLAAALLTLPEPAIAKAMQQERRATAPPSRPRLQGVQFYERAFYAPFHPKTALDMLLHTPGFELDMGSGGRGLEGAAGNVLVNGVRPPAKAAPITSVLMAIPAADVVAIVLVPAGVADVDMAGYPVLANVIHKTRPGMELSGTLGATSSGRDGNTRTAMAELRFSRPGRIVSANASNSRLRARTRGGWVAPVVGQSAARRSSGTRSDSDTTQFSTSAQWDLHGGRRLQLRANLSRLSSTSQPLPDAGDVAAVDLSSEAARRGGDLAAEMQWPLGRDIDLSMTTLLSRDDTTARSQLRSTERDSMSLGRSSAGETAMRSQLRWRLSPAWRVEAGVDHADNFLDGAFAYRVDGVDIKVPGASSRVEERRDGVFAAAAFQPTPQWMAEFGLRWESAVLRNRGDRASQARFDDLLPRISATWSPGEGSRWRARVEREVGQLAFGQFLATVALQEQTVTAGAATLEPERSWVYALDYEHRFGERGLLSAGIERTRTDNPIDVVVADGGVEMSANVGVATVDSLAFDLSAPLDAWGLRGGLLTVANRFAYSRTTDPVTGARREVSTTPPHAWSLQLRQDLPGGHGAWGLTAAGGGEYTTYGVRRITRMDRSDSVSLFGEWRPRESLGLRLSLTNGARIRTESLLFAAPRAAAVPADLTHVALDHRQSIWQATLEWVPKPEARFELALATGSDTRLVSRTLPPPSSGLSPTVQELEFSAQPTVSTQVKLRW